MMLLMMICSASVFAVEVQVLPFIDFIKRDHKRLRSTF